MARNGDCTQYTGSRFLSGWASFFSTSIRIPSVLLVSLIYLQAAVAQETFAPTAFTECPSRAFLTQGKQPATYAVNLITGEFYVVAQSHGTSSSLNAVGFNENDRFIYGWSYEYKQPARIHNDWQMEPLLGVNTTDSNFFTGDVSLVENKYYVYRKGAGYGLYSIGLDPAASDYLIMNKVRDGSELFINIYDMAFHPTDGFAYMVDTKGNLFKVRAADGSFQNLGSTGVTGTFGATYFDADGNLYIGRNNDGAVYRIAIDAADFRAELFTLGPAASTNDGSRCALAPLADVADMRIDFGDAPDTYGTSLQNNGARHGLSSSPDLYLGAIVDGESESSVFPLSDDAAGQNDEDGVQFVTSIMEGETAIILVTASGTGYLNAWIDYNRNGVFDDHEKIIADSLTAAGQKAHYIDVPSGVSAGESWARFRISSSAGLPANGGTIDGEVEDYQVSILRQETVVSYYPSPIGWTTVAFEDNWPFMGDYDLNDIVFYLRSSIHRNDTGVSRVVIEGELAAVGASYHNGFAIRLPGILRSDVDSNNLEFKINGIPVTGLNPLESGRNEAILIIANDIFDYVSPGEECTYYRSEAGCGSAIDFTFSMSVPMKNPVAASVSGVFDPFIFATPGKWHGPQFANPPGRSYEIHLKNQAPTEAFNQQLFADVGQDASNPTAGKYFQTRTGLPWAIEIGSRWDYPLEFNEVSKAYPAFKKYAESDGKQEAYWYAPEKAVNTHVFKD